MLFSSVVAALTPLCNDPSSVCPIESAKYLGTWYEIGRSEIIRNTFEKDSACVVAQYSLKENGDVNVFNTNVDETNNGFKSINGSAKILAPGKLKVAFGGDSLGGRIGEAIQNLIPGANYNVQNVWYDEQGNYRRALVTFGRILPPNFQFIWILSRDEDVSDAEVAEYLDYAKRVGFNVENAKWKRTLCSDSQRQVRKQNIGI